MIMTNTQILKELKRIFNEIKSRGDKYLIKESNHV